MVFDQDVRRASESACIQPSQHELANHRQRNHHQTIFLRLQKVLIHQKPSRSRHHPRYMVTLKVCLCMCLAFYYPLHWSCSKDVPAFPRSAVDGLLDHLDANTTSRRLSNNKRKQLDNSISRPFTTDVTREWRYKATTSKT